MGMSYYRIRKISSVRPGDRYCPECGKKLLHVVLDTSEDRDVELSYCPLDEMFFDFDTGFFLDKEAKGIEKLKGSTGGLPDYWHR